MSSEQTTARHKPALTVERVDHLALVVRDVRASSRWYEEMFGFESLGSAPGSSPYYLGNRQIKLALLQTPETSDFMTPVNQGAWQCHFAFETDRETYEAYRRRLEQRGIDYDTLKHSDSESIYFPDPDGYVVEVTYHGLPDR